MYPAVRHTAEESFNRSMLKKYSPKPRKAVSCTGDAFCCKIEKQIMMKVPTSGPPRAETANDSTLVRRRLHGVVVADQNLDRGIEVRAGAHRTTQLGGRHPQHAPGVNVVVDHGAAGVNGSFICGTEGVGDTKGNASTSS